MRLSPRCGAREKMKGEGCSSNSWESCVIFSGSLKATSGPCKARGVGLRHFTKPNSSSKNGETVGILYPLNEGRNTHSESLG